MTEGIRRAGGGGGRACFAAGALAGCAVFLLLYGAAPLNVCDDAWIFGGYVEDDIVQHHAGWLFFRNAPWDWPLTVAGNLAVPHGISVVFTDSIPALAVFFKLLSPVLPPVFQYMGPYVLVCFALGGGFAALLLRHFALPVPFCAAGSLLFVCAPVALERAFRHVALTSHWLILAALLCYFKARRAGSFARGRGFPFAGFLALCAFAPAVHSYFLPMIYALLAAALAERIAKDRRALRPCAYLFICLAATLAACGALGILTRGGGGEAFGYGHYSMNLNALINPKSMDLYAESGSVDWSLFLPQRPQTRGQYDGFNYMGAGVLAALAAMCVYGAARAVRAAVKRDKAPFAAVGRFVAGHVWLLAVCAALSAFAVSYVVVWDGATLLDAKIPLPGPAAALVSAFRASGRMFWVCGYLLFLAVLLWLGRVLRARWRAAALCLLLAVQLTDISPALAAKHGFFARAAARQDVYSGAEMRFLMGGYDEKYTMSFFEDYKLAAAMIRYNPRTVTNYILSNRGGFESVHAGYEGLVAQLCSGQPLPEGALYIFSEDWLFYSVLQHVHPSARGYILGKYFFIATALEGCPLPEVTADG